MSKKVFIAAIIITFIFNTQMQNIYANVEKSIFKELDWAKANKIFPTNTDYSSTITKREFVQAIMNYLYDLKNTDSKCNYLCMAQKNGILKHTYDLDLPLNYAKASKILLSSIGIYVADLDPWYKLWVDQMNKFKWIDNNIKSPTEIITKYEAVSMLYHSPIRFRKQSSDYIKDVSNFVISYIENIEAGNFDILLNTYWPKTIINDIYSKCNLEPDKRPTDLLNNNELRKIWDNCARFKTYQVEVTKVDKNDNSTEFIVNTMFFQMKNANRSYFGNIEIKVKYIPEEGYRTSDFILVKDIL